MNPTLDTFQYAADLTKRLGAAPFPNGKTVSEMFSIDGVSLWDTVACVLALYRLPMDLTRKTPPTLFNRLLKPYLSLAKQRIKSLIPFPRSSSGCARWPSKPVCLLLGFSGYIYRDVLEPIKRYFDANHEMNCVVLHDDGRLQPTAVKLSGDGVQSIWQHWNASVAADERVIRRAIRTANDHFKIVDILPDLISGGKQDLCRGFEGTFYWLFMVYLPMLAPYLALARHILKAHCPAIIISPDVADPRTRLFCLAGRLLGIPSLEIQFGSYAEEAVEWQFFAADKVAVWGEQARKVLSGQGIPDNRIILTGSPRFDDLVNIDSARIAATRSRLGIATGKRMVLFASYYSLSCYNEYYNSRCASLVKRAIFKAADRIEGLCLVVKPHPLENVPETKQIAKGCQRIIFADQNEDIRELTKACDVFITLGSTATMEALVARKLVIFPSFPGFVWWDDMYLKNNVVIVVKSEEELANKLKEAIGGQREKLFDELEPARQRFLNERVHQPDGQATNRIADLAMKMAELRYIR